MEFGFCFRNKYCFFPRAGKFLVSSAFWPFLDYGDVSHLGASNKCSQSLVAVCHCSLRFPTGCKHLTQHSTPLNVGSVFLFCLNSTWFGSCKFIFISPKALTAFVLVMFYICLSLVSTRVRYKSVWFHSFGSIGSIFNDRQRETVEQCSSTVTLFIINAFYL